MAELQEDIALLEELIANEAIPADEKAGYIKALNNLKSQQPTEQPTDNSLSNNNWFKTHPEKILGAVTLKNDRFGKEIEYVTGTLNDLEKINAELDLGQIGMEQVGVSTVALPIAEEVNQPGMQQKVKAIIEKGKKDIGKKLIAKKRKAEAMASDAPTPADIQTFSDIYNSSLNENISLEELKVFIWYKESIGQRLSHNWYELAYPELGDLEGETLTTGRGAVLDSWVKQGLLYYYNGNLLPAYLYLAENVYEKYSRLVELNEGENSGQDKQVIIEKYGQQVYDKQLKKLTEVYNLQAAKRLIIKPGDDESGLIILPTSEFARTFKISSFADGQEIKWALSKRNDDYGKPDYFKYDENEWRKHVFKNISLTDAFCVWLVQERNNIEFKKRTNYRDIIELYIQNKTRQAPRHLSEEEQKAWKAELARQRSRCKEEGDRLFRQFLYSEIELNDRTRIEMQWSKDYNAYVPIDYSKVPVAFNMAKEYRGEALDVRPEKREAVAFVFNQGSGGLAYDVGVGKTISAIFAIEQFLVAGYSKRPFIVVPNQTYKQWLGEIRGVLPHRKVNDLYNLSKDYIEQLYDENNKVMAVDEYSISVMTYEGFEQIGFNEDTENTLLRELADITENQGEKNNRQVEAQFQRLQEIIGKSLRGTLISIEDLGFDFICVDEAHAMKKVFTKVTGTEGKDDEDDKPKGKYNKNQYKFTSGEQSARALKGFCITQYIQQNNFGRNVLLLTATPFTNSPLEVFSMLSLMAYKELQRTNMNNIVNFFDNYTKTTTELVITISMKPKYKQIIKGFNNLVSLKSLIRRYWSVKRAEDIPNLVRPNKYVIPYTKKMVDGNMVRLPENERIDSFLQMTPQQAAYMDRIKAFAGNGTGIRPSEMVDLSSDIEPGDESDSGESVSMDEMDSKQKQSAVLLQAANMARNLALSPYLYKESGLGKNPAYKEYVESSPKLKYVMECIRSVRNYHLEKGEPISGQVIYMDRGLDYFPLLKDYLVHEIGYQPHEIGMIFSKMKGKQDKEYIKNLFNGERYNPQTKEVEPVSDAERIKIVIGSGAIKEGINLQKKATVLYNCFLDWNPTDLVQLQGRIHRQQNEYENVRIVNPLMVDSIDIFMFQKLEEKTSRINDLLSPDNGENFLKMEDIDPMETKSALIKDPFILAEMLLEDEITKLEDEKASIGAYIKRVQNIKDARNLYSNSWIDEIQEIVKAYRPDFTSKREEEWVKQYVDLLRKPTDKDGLPIIVDANERQKLIESGKKVSPVTSAPSKLYWTDRVLQAYKLVAREEREFLKPRNLNLYDLDSAEKEIENRGKILEEKIKELRSENTIAEKAKEIIEYREKNKVEFKSIDTLVKEFERLNYLLSIKRNKKEVAKFEPETACELLDDEGLPRIDAEALQHLTECVKRMPQTKDLWVDESGEYVPQRKALHENIIAKLRQGLSCVHQDKPIAILTGGSPGSGKSTFLKKYAKYLASDKIFKIDADAVREMLPEYRGWNSFNTQLEQKDIIQRLISDREIGIPCKFDLIYDGTMNSTKNYLPLIGLLKRLGYRIFIVYMDNIPYSVIKERVLGRYRRGGANRGRFVPLEVIDDFFMKGKDALNQLKTKVDGYMVIDGSSDEYKIIERGGIEIPQDRDYSILGQPIKAEKKFDAGLLQKRVNMLKLEIKMKTSKNPDITNKRIKMLELQLKMKQMKKGGEVDAKGIDLFEDYENIPPKVQRILDKYQDGFEDGDYAELEKALKELKLVGYTFDYYIELIEKRIKGLELTQKINPSDITAKRIKGLKIRLLQLQNK